MSIKDVKNILLTDIDIRPETIVRQSLFECLKGKPDKWLSNIKKKEPIQYEQLKELMASMKSGGQIETIGVYQIDVSEELLKEDGREGVYILVTGLRRFLAAYFLDWKRIKAAILDIK